MIKVSEKPQRGRQEARERESEAPDAGRRMPDAVEYEQTKSSFSQFLSGTGKSEKKGEGKSEQGDTGKSELAGLHSSDGRVGGDLGNRGVLYVPVVDENSQRTGRVVIRVCVDQTGNVIEAYFTQRGSTTADAHLVETAIKSSKEYRFTKSDLKKQCGSITFEFKLK